MSTDNRPDRTMDALWEKMKKDNPNVARVRRYEVSEAEGEFLGGVRVEITEVKTGRVLSEIEVRALLERWMRAGLLNPSLAAVTRGGDLP